MEIYDEYRDKYNRLNASERDFLWAHPVAAVDFNFNASVALKEAQKRFGAGSLHNGSGDAMRHCFWSTMNTRDQGKRLAKMFGDAHEAFDGNPSNEKAMDLHNNSVGYEIGVASPGASDRHLAVICVQAWTARKLLQIDGVKSNDLIYSNSTENYIYGAHK